MKPNVSQIKRASSPGLIKVQQSMLNRCAVGRRGSYRLTSPYLGNLILGIHICGSCPELAGSFEILPGLP